MSINVYFVCVGNRPHARHVASSFKQYMDCNVVQITDAETPALPGIDRVIRRTYPGHMMLMSVFDIVNELRQMRGTILLENLRNIHPSIKVAPFWLCESLDDIKHTYEKLVKEKYEGIIIRHFESPYERKRSTWVMKFKPKKKDTYKITGYTEEVSKNGVPKGRLGSLEMSSQDGETFNVSAGLDSEERERLWDIRELLIGLKCNSSLSTLNR